ncbi:23773_t:CDS:2, partial [Entrophospora sp. SA101]
DNLNSKRKELNEETRGQIVGMSRAGSSEREIITHTTSSTPQSGRPKLIGEEKE